MKKFCKYVLTLLVIFVVLFSLSNLIFLSSSGSTIQHTRLEKLVGISLIVTLTSLIFKDKVLYYKKLFYLFFLYSSAFVVFFLDNAHTNFKFISENLIFNLSIANLLLLISALLQNKKIKYFILPLLILIGFMPTIISILYYSIYHSIFTTDSLIAIMQTNLSESSDFIKMYFHSGTLIAILICIALIVFTFQLLNRSITSNKPKSYYLIIFIVLSLVGIYIGSSNILTLPYRDYYYLQKNFGTYKNNQQVRQKLIKENLIANTNDSGVYILVVGESHSKLYTSPYNYKVNSTPWLKKITDNPNFILFNDAYSCMPQTVQALYYALTLKNQYNSLSIDSAPSLLEIANSAGYETVWISNQSKFGINDTGVSVISQQANSSYWVNKDGENIYSLDKKSSYDGGVLPVLKRLPLKKKILIIIHLYGSHGIYTDRFPKEFAKFHNLGDKRIDDYVNSVYYNDYVMQEIYTYAKTIPNFKAMVYFSDHAEDIYIGHNATNYKPDMVCIPMYMYFSDSYIKEYPKEFAALKKAQDYTFTNDLITNTMLSIMHIKLKNYYEPDNDLANPEYNHDFTRFRTLYGRAPLTDWHTLKPE